MIQQTVSAQAPRLHPKKRKFDLSELEDSPSTATMSGISGNNSTITTISNPMTISSPHEKISVGSTMTTVAYNRTSDSDQNGNQQFAARNNFNSQHVVAQVAKNTGEVQQIIKRQFTNFRWINYDSLLFILSKLFTLHIFYNF